MGCLSCYTLTLANRSILFLELFSDKQMLHCDNYLNTSDNILAGVLLL